ncbi:hypothetical protein JVT61DRAFT_15434 [Boletus reticuloceps]|uniref:Uncharacterized protein n=1 Tax=Boletus reticuloceps TaxID=495285 RepID=A0A8I3ACK9_9AGAM|nr:hypothetical protein JVT61DRAFT_15434 [Boletus reticuloceps]
MSMSSPPPSPLRVTLTVSTVANAFIKFRRARHDALDFASGLPITHPTLCGEDATCRRRVPLEHADRYVCKGAVDVTKLLRGSRASLLEKAVLIGANVLVEERYVSLPVSISFRRQAVCLWLWSLWVWPVATPAGGRFRTPTDRTRVFEASQTADGVSFLQLGLPDTYTQKQAGRQVSGAGQSRHIAFGPNTNHTDVD